MLQAGVILIMLAVLTAGAVLRGSVSVVGWCMVAVGVVIAVAGRPRTLYGFLLKETGGIVYVATGLLLVTRPDAAPVILAGVIALFLALQGVIRILRVPAAARVGWTLTHGIVCLVLAFITGIWALQRAVVGLVMGMLTFQQWPAPGLRVIGLFIVVDMLLNGWAFIRSRTPGRDPAPSLG